MTPRRPRAAARPPRGRRRDHPPTRAGAAWPSPRATGCASPRRDHRPHPRRRDPAPGWLAALCEALDDPSLGLATSATAGDRRHPGGRLVAGRVRGRLRPSACRTCPTALPGALALALAERGGRAITVPAASVAAPAPAPVARGTPGATPELTVVIPTLDAGVRRVRACIAAVQARPTSARDRDHRQREPSAGVRLPGQRRTACGADALVVVMNDDVEPLAGWWAPLRATLDAGASVAFPLTVNGPMRCDFPAWCFALTAETPSSGTRPGRVLRSRARRVVSGHRPAAAAAPGRPVAGTGQGSRIHHGLSAQ